MKRKNIILTILVIILLFVLAFIISITYTTIDQYNSSKAFYNSMMEFTEKNREKIFYIDKITFFSSADGEIATNSNSAFTISNLYQYTDIAIFISTYDKNSSLKNTLKKVELTDIKFPVVPSIGAQNLYYKPLNDFATSKFSKDNLIENSIQFNTTSEDKIDYLSPVLYNNCANPITLCYVNSNLRETQTLFDNISNLSHNGSLLKLCSITLNSISCKIELTVKITNYLDEVFTCPVLLEIPLSTENSTVYDGSLLFKESVQSEFIREQ